jgi:S-DNA-T family DNA segregation ATPase FtsK/SpoIIIE
MKKQRKGNSAGTPKTALPHFLVKRFSEGSFILIIAAAMFVLLALFSYQPQDLELLHSGLAGDVSNAGGRVGAYIADVLSLSFGYIAYVLPLSIALVAWMVLKDHRSFKSVNKAMLLLRTTGLLFLFVAGCGLLAIELQGSKFAGIHPPGGGFGHIVAYLFSQALNVQGAVLLLLAMLMVGLTWLTGISWVNTTETIGYYTLHAVNGLLKLSAIIKPWFSAGINRVRAFERKPKPLMIENKSPSILPIVEKKKPQIEKPEKEKSEKEKTIPRITIPEAPVEKLRASVRANKESRIPKVQVSGSLPSLNLLEKGQPGKPLGGFSHQELETLSRDVEQHLLDFGIQADVVAVLPGPVITRFELQLAAGIKVSKLTALAKDLARSLSVTSVRVVEIIPGKTVVGIELPNQNRAMVCLADVLSADVYQQAHSSLTLALGVDIAGHPMVVDLAKMPHLLVAGTTGSGKSVGINAMILSLLFKATPEQVRLIMVDPKMLELSVYDGIPHLLTPVVTDMKEAASALRWCVGEMERRYRLMSALGVRNLAGYNTKIEEAAARNEVLSDPLWKPIDSMDEEAPALEALPYIVVVIDELADMMMVVGKKVEQLIARIAQKARAAGIHLILATQRPSVDVLTGLIKSNIPTRISFQVSSKIDSRTILDQQGAEQLLGHGDMLFLAPGTGAPLRVHGAFVDDREVHRVADDWRSRGEPEYIDEITEILGDGLEGGGSNDENQATEEADALYDQAVEFVIQTRKASISAVQRRFKIGYNRAARLVEEMERVGVVGPLEGGFRDVLVTTAAD